MNTPEYNAAFMKGQTHGSAMLANKIVSEIWSEKLHFIKEQMYQVAAARGANLNDPEWKAFAEGVRQTLNILSSAAPPQEAYTTIIAKGFDVLKGEKL